MANKTSELGIKLLCYSEGGNRLKAYPDSCVPPVWTIAVGCIMINNRRVVEGDTILPEQGIEMLKNNLTQREARLNFLVPNLAQNKFDAIINLAYQEGAWEGSTLVRLARINPDDPQIRNEFKKWIMVSGKPSDGVIIRRAREILMYFPEMHQNDLIAEWPALKEALNKTRQSLNDWMN